VVTTLLALLETKGTDVAGAIPTIAIARISASTPGRTTVGTFHRLFMQALHGASEHRRIMVRAQGVLLRSTHMVFSPFASGNFVTLGNLICTEKSSKMFVPLHGATYRTPLLSTLFCDFQLGLCHRKRGA